MTSMRLPGSFPRQGGAVEGVGGKRVKQGFPRAAADYVNDFHAVAGELLQPAEHLAVPEREALVGATHQLAFGFRHRLFGFAAEVLDRLGHVGRVEEARVVGIDDGPLPVWPPAGAAPAHWKRSVVLPFRRRNPTA